MKPKPTSSLELRFHKAIFTCGIHFSPFLATLNEKATLLAMHLINLFFSQSKIYKKFFPNSKVFFRHLTLQDKEVGSPMSVNLFASKPKFLSDELEIFLVWGKLTTATDEADLWVPELVPPPQYCLCWPQWLSTHSPGFYRETPVIHLGTFCMQRICSMMDTVYGLTPRNSTSHLIYWWIVMEAVMDWLIAHSSFHDTQA